jgi:hypothetical protein
MVHYKHCQWRKTTEYETCTHTRFFTGIAVLFYLLEDGLFSSFFQFNSISYAASNGSINVNDEVVRMWKKAIKVCFNVRSQHLSGGPEKVHITSG